MVGLSLRPLKEPRSVDDDLAIGRQFDVRAVHWPRRRAFKIYAFTVVAAAVARALEFVFAGFPVGRAAEMRAARVDDENTVGRAVHPDAVFLLPLGVDTERVVGGISDFEDGGRLEERARKEEAQEGDEPRAEKAGDAAPHQSAAAFLDLAIVGADGCNTRGACRFGG